MSLGEAHLQGVKFPLVSLDLTQHPVPALCFSHSVFSKVDSQKRLMVFYPAVMVFPMQNAQVLGSLKLSQIEGNRISSVWLKKGICNRQLEGFMALLSRLERH